MAPELDSDALTGDLPSLRGYEWKRRAKEILERDGECRRCGDSNENYENRNPVGLSAHHIVPGRELPKDDARIGLNLVAVCSRCHQRLEETNPRHQFPAVGFEVAGSITKYLDANGPTTKGELLGSLEFEREIIEDRLEKLQRLELVDIHTDQSVELAMRLESEQKETRSLIERRWVWSEEDE